VNPYQIIRDFESALCEYTGAPHAVAVDSCTNALFLACKFVGVREVHIPRRTYRSVPMAIIHAGGHVVFGDVGWMGAYRLNPYPIYDAARRFTSGMYKGGFWCVSFHAKKILGDTQGGAILCGSKEAAEWFRKARFDGRTEGASTQDDPPTMLGYHCRMSVDVAARLLEKLSFLPRHNEDLPPDPYEDLSAYEVFR
jgi:dTDP-4-amino-4,6-dideoxygalactose transaminase